jgi:hypothetical protein
MPRAARAVKLETRTARAKLPARRAPYFVKVTKGLRLGYYRGRGFGSGTWIGRRYLGSRHYETSPIGIADDTTSADNIAVFDFWQAQDALRRWGERGRRRSRHQPYRPLYGRRGHRGLFGRDRHRKARCGVEGRQVYFRGVGAARARSSSGRETYPDQIRTWHNKRVHPVKALRAGASCRLIQVPVSVGRDLESCK